MPNLHTPQGAIYLLQILLSVFLAICFLQSGIDKIIDRQGNLEWLTGHFAKSPLGPHVPLLLTLLTFLELVTGILTAFGFVQLLLTRGSTVAFYGAVAAAITIVSLFFGQRIAKEYGGAAILVPYFLVAITAVYLLA
jgi:uncharacterized membrane protein YphA (DoxX/SURF4 family)